MRGSESDEVSSVNVTSDIKAEFDNPARKKRQFCCRHNVYAVSSIETALDGKNYEPIEYPHVAIDHVAVPLEKKHKNIIKTIILTTEKWKKQLKQFDKFLGTLFKIDQL